MGVPRHPIGRMTAAGGVSVARGIDRGRDPDIEKAAWNRIRNLIWTRRLCCLKADFAVSLN